MNDLEKFRTRWYRWLGQKCRRDKPYWTDLLSSNWTGWVESVMEKKGCSPPNGDWEKFGTSGSIKHYFEIAIHNADMEDLIKLDNLYCTENIKKMER